jgi:RNA polymerase sigma-70 factor (ECF subfamily)
MTDHASDGTLLDRWRSGDTAAFAALVECFQGPLLRHARGVLGQGRAHEDVVQEAFLKLAEAPPDLPERCRGDAAAERAQLGAWLHTVTRNLCMDTLRADFRRQHRESDAAPPSEHTPHDDGLAGVDANDTRAAVQRSLDKLPQDQREVLVLRLLDEKSYAEIADITGRKVGTVGWLISVGLKALARELAPLLQGAPHGSGEWVSGEQAARLQA